MSAPRIVLLSAFLLVVAPISANAQERPPITPGDRVRVTAPTVSTRPFEGDVLAVQSDTLIIECEDLGAPAYAVA